MAKTGSVAVQMEELLDECSVRVKDVLKAASKETAQETVQRLRSTSPRKTGSYAKGWRVSTQRGDYIVHNATDYQLTHLLENGHVVRNKKGTYGRAPAHKHIAPAESWAIEEFQNKIERGLR